MMKHLLLGLSFLSLQAMAYVPTVESLFRNGANPDITANAVMISLKVTHLAPTGQAEGSLLGDQKQEEFFRLYFQQSSPDTWKVSQARYSDGTFSESSFIDKVYHPNFTAFSLKGAGEESEKGLFFATLTSMLFNNGSFMMNYLKSLGVPVRPNTELINREKVALLAEYKRYLTAVNKDRMAKRSLQNPLAPDDPSSRERAERIMKDPMYVDTNHVTLSRQEGSVAWLVSAGAFEAVISYKLREIQKIKFKSKLGEFEISAKEYGLANGTHHLPKYVFVKDYKGGQYQLEFSDLRHYNEKEEDLVRRLKKWDSITKASGVISQRPPFLL